MRPRCAGRRRPGGARGDHLPPRSTHPGHGARRAAPPAGPGRPAPPAGRGRPSPRRRGRPPGRGGRREPVGGRAPPGQWRHGLRPDADLDPRPVGQRRLRPAHSSPPDPHPRDRRVPGRRPGAVGDRPAPRRCRQRPDRHHPPAAGGRPEAERLPLPWRRRRDLATSGAGLRRGTRARRPAQRQLPEHGTDPRLRRRHRRQDARCQGGPGPGSPGVRDRLCPARGRQPRHPGRPAQRRVDHDPRRPGGRGRDGAPPGGRGDRPACGGTAHRARARVASHGAAHADLVVCDAVPGRAPPAWRADLPAAGRRLLRAPRGDGPDRRTPRRPRPQRRPGTLRLPSEPVRRPARRDAAPDCAERRAAVLAPAPRGGIR